MTNLKEQFGTICGVIATLAFVFGFVLLTGWNEENFIPIMVVGVIVLFGLCCMMTKWGYGDEQQE